MMKNIKKGFTLAEALIAIAIVGVIAAITIPSVVSETQNGKLAASLGRNVEAIETGCQMIIHHANETNTNGDTIYGLFVINNTIDGDTDNNSNRLINNIFSDNVSEFFNIVPLSVDKKNDYISQIRDINGAAQNAFTNYQGENWHFAVSSKLGAYYGYNSLSNIPNEEDPVLGYVYIDVNQTNPPNRYGRDIFLFGLTDSCHMVPAGTLKIRNMNSSIPLENSGCGGNNPTNGLSCTSRVVKNGYKMDY
jgi:prepilin-type N-terminal cleavage/methylation domain-containing protein